MYLRLVIGFVLFGILASCQKGGDEVQEELESVGYALTSGDLHRAAGAGELAVMATMLEGGVDPSGRVDGETAMHVAARAGHEEAIDLLLRHGAVVDVLGREGRTPLMSAAEANEVSAVEFLVKNGAEVALRDELGFRAMTLAAERGATEVVEALANLSRENIDDALFLAALRGHAGTVEVLVRSGASVYVRTEEGKTALMMAAREGHEEVVQVLLEHGANRYAVDFEGFTAGQIAMGAGELEVGQVLLAEPGEEEFSLAEVTELMEAEMVAMNVAGEESGQDPAPVSEQVVESAGAPLRLPGSKSVSVNPAVHLVAAPGAPRRKGEAEIVRHPVVMKHYRERPLPLRVESVVGKEVQVRFLYGEQKEVTVREGEEIPFTGLRVVSVQERRQRTKESGNQFADVSAVLVEDPRTGLRRELVTHLSASAHEPFAIVSSQEGGNQVARRGSLVRSAEGGQFRVLDVRPSQVVLENLATGEVSTVRLDGRN